MGESVITRAESGTRPPVPEVFEAWIETCDVKGDLKTAMEDMWLLARSKSDPAAVQTAPWDAVEAEAHTLRTWQLVILPGLVQTEEYARALFVAWGHDEERIASLVKGRMARKSILEREVPPDVTIVLWEPVLRNLIGSPAVMHDQIARLLELSERPYIHIHVLQSGSGANMGMGSSIELATTETTEMVLMEGFSENVVTSEMSQVRRAASIFNTVRSDALNRAESRAILTEAMEEWRNKARTGGRPATATAHKAADA